MARLDYVRERRAFFVYDTLAHPDLAKRPGGRSFEGADGCRMWHLFGNTNLGLRDHCNMQNPGTVDENAHTVLMTIYAKIWFNCDVDEARERLNAIETGTILQVLVSEKPAVEVPLLLPLPDELRGEGREDEVSAGAREFYEKNFFSPTCRSYVMPIADRQANGIAFFHPYTFAVMVNMNPAAADALAHKSAVFRVYLGGIKHRDIA